MDIKKFRDGSSLIISLNGRLDAVTSIEFDKSLQSELDDVELLTINLAKLSYIASAGLRILLKIKKRMEEQGNLKIINVSPEVREVMDMTGFSDFLLPDDDKKNFNGFSVEF